MGHPTDRRGRRRSSRPPWPATGSASSRPRPRSRRSTPTPGRPRRPTGCRSSSGTTSWCASPTAPSSASTGPWRSARPTARERAWPPWRGSTRPCRATPPSRPTCTNGTATSSDRRPPLRRSGPAGVQPPRARPPHPAGGTTQRRRVTPRAGSFVTSWAGPTAPACSPATGCAAPLSGGGHWRGAAPPRGRPRALARARRASPGTGPWRRP